MDPAITDSNEGIMFPDPATPAPAAENGAFVDPTLPDMGAVGNGTAPTDYPNLSPEEMMYAYESKRQLDEAVRQGAVVDDEIRVSQERVEQAQQRIMGEFFQMMIDSGVDPNNLEDLQKFFERLEHSNPDLLEMFTIALDAIAGTPGQGGNLFPAEKVPANPATPIV